MTLDPQVINAIFSGLVLVLGAVATLVTARGRRAAVDRRDYRLLQRAHVVALQHIFTLETIIAGLGHEPPPRPDLLDRDDDRDTTPAALPPPPKPPRGRHGG